MNQNPAEGARPVTPLVRAVRALEWTVALLSRFALAVSALLLGAILVLITYSVGMRYFAGQPQPWIDEAAGWLLVGSVMLAAPEVQRRGENIGIDFLFQKLKGRKRQVLLAFGVLTVLATAIIFTREGMVMVAFSRMVNVLSNQLPDVPLWAVQTFVPAGFGLVILVAATQLLCLSLGLKPRDMSDPKGEEFT